MSDPRIYWAKYEGQDLADAIIARVQEYNSSLDNTGRSLIWQASECAWYGTDPQGTWSTSKAVQSAGEMGELATVYINDYRNLGKHRLALTVADRPHFEAKPINTDSESVAQSIVAESVLEYALKTDQLEARFSKVAEYEQRYGEGFLSLEWDAFGGAPHGADPTTGRVVYEGRIEAEALQPWDVIRDPSLRDSGWKWLIRRKWFDRYELAARFPEHEDHILNTSADLDLDRGLYNTENRIQDLGLSQNQIALYVLHHDKTVALPEGRIAYVIGRKLMFAGPTPYTRIPIVKMIADAQDGTPHGSALLWDLLGITSANSSFYSTALSNHNAFGVQNITSPEGSNVNVEDLGGGLKHVTYNPAAGKPEALQLVAISPDSYRLMEAFERKSEQISAVNSVVRGQPDEALKDGSGAALALVQAQALSFNSSNVAAYELMIEECANLYLDLVRTFWTLPRTIEVAGKSQRSYVKQVKGESIGAIGRVQVIRRNPLERSQAGRMKILEYVEKMGAIRAPEQITEVLATGRLEPLYQSERDQQVLVWSENEKLADGVPVEALRTDDHLLHLREHPCVLSSPEARERPELIANAMDHLAQHWQLASMLTPEQAAAMGQTELADILAKMQPPPMPPGAPMPGGGGPPPDEQAVVPGVTGDPGSAGAAMVAENLPNMPTNPATGDPAQVPGVI